MTKSTNTQFYKYGDPQTHKWIVIMWTNTPVNGVGPSMSCPFHEGGGLCAKTTCAILLHKELRVNIAVHVSKDIKKYTQTQTQNKSKTTCAILLHKEHRVNIAVHVSRHIRKWCFDSLIRISTMWSTHCANEARQLYSVLQKIQLLPGVLNSSPYLQISNQELNTLGH